LTDSLYIPIIDQDYADIELWEYRGGATNPELKWTLPFVASGAISGIEAGSIFYDSDRDRLILNTMDWDDAWEVLTKRSWEWDRIGSPVQLKAPFNINDKYGDASYDVPIDALKWNGKYYIFNAGQDCQPCWLARYDPADPEATYEVVLQSNIVGSNESEGGLAIRGIYLYCVMPDRVYRSTTGDSGSWELVADMQVTYGVRDITAAVHDPFTDNVYFAGFKRTGVSPNYQYYRSIWRIDASGLALDFEEEVSGNGIQFSAIACPGDAQPVAISWYQEDPGRKIYRRQSDGSWTLEETFTTIPDGDYMRMLAKQTAFFYEGKLHILLGAWGNQTGLYRRESIGNWTQVKLWTGTNYAPAYHFGGCMAIGPSSLSARRPRIQFIRIGR
jgi:hypothetical protein